MRGAWQRGHHAWLKRWWSLRHTNFWDVNAPFSNYNMLHSSFAWGVLNGWKSVLLKAWVNKIMEHHGKSMKIWEVVVSFDLQQHEASVWLQGKTHFRIGLEWFGQDNVNSCLVSQTSKLQEPLRATRKPATFTDTSLLCGADCSVRADIYRENWVRGATTIAYSKSWDRKHEETTIGWECGDRLERFI